MSRYTATILSFLSAVAVSVSLSSSPASAAEKTWRHVSEFPAIGLHASGSTVIAWNMLQYAISTDGGETWSNPVAPTEKGQRAEPIRLALATPNDGLLVLTSTGKVLNAAVANATATTAPAASNVVLAGDGAVFVEGIDGTVSTLNGAEAVRGRIYRAVKHGVIVHGDKKDKLFLLRANGTKPDKVQFKGENLPVQMDLAPLTTAGGDRWTTTRGTTWIFKDDSVMAFGEREAQPKAYAFGPEGYHELLAWRGLQITYLQGSGLAGHWRTKDLPQDAAVLTAGAKNFVVAGPSGIYFVPIARE
jgi:hypothetical protein